MASHPPQPAGGGRRSSHPLACSSAHMGSPLQSESFESDQPQNFDLLYSWNSRKKPTATSDLHSTATTYRVSPGSWRRQSWSTAPRGSPWIHRDSSGQSQQGEKVSKDRHSTLQILWSLVTHLDIAGAVGLFWTHTAVTSIGPKGRKSDSSLSWWANYWIKHWRD